MTITCTYGYSFERLRKAVKEDPVIRVWGADNAWGGIQVNGALHVCGRALGGEAWGASLIIAEGRVVAIEDQIRDEKESSR